MDIVKIIQSNHFKDWLESLKDRNAKARIEARLRRIQMGNMGDVKPVGNGINEARIDYGAGYRLYFLQRGKTIIVMLAGGDKRRQQSDIAKAIQISKEWKNTHD